MNCASERCCLHVAFSEKIVVISPATTGQRTHRRLLSDGLHRHSGDAVVQVLFPRGEHEMKSAAPTVTTHDERAPHDRCLYTNHGFQVTRYPEVARAPPALSTFVGIRNRSHVWHFTKLGCCRSFKTCLRQTSNIHTFVSKLPHPGPSLRNVIPLHRLPYSCRWQLSPSASRLLSSFSSPSSRFTGPSISSLGASPFNAVTWRKFAVTSWSRRHSRHFQHLMHKCETKKKTRASSRAVKCQWSVSGPFCGRGEE